jgi:predicted PurR-regulated permease PerM
VLVSILIGAKVAGILGALGAIPVAGAIQVLVIDWHQHRRARARAPSPVRGATEQPVQDPPIG